MKKLRIIIVVIVIVLSLLLSSCNSKEIIEYQSNYFVATPQNLHNTLLQRIEITIDDLGLTQSEMNVIEKYQQYGNVLRAICYNWPSKAEALTYENVDYELGVDVFEMQAIEKVLGINIGISRKSLTSGIDDIKTAQADMIAGIYLSDSNENYGEYKASGCATDFIYAYSLNDIQMNQISDLEGLRVGILRDLSLFETEIMEQIGHRDISFELSDYFLSENQALRALKNDEIDIIVQTFSTNLIQKGCTFKNISHVFPDNLSNIMFSAVDSDLLYLQSAIEKLYAYDTYMYDLKQDYMGLYSTMLVGGGRIFSEEEVEFIQNSKTDPVKIVAQSNSYPFTYIDQITGNWDGITYRTWKRITSIAGLDFSISTNTDSSWEDSLQSIGLHEGEITNNAAMPVCTSTEKAKYLNFASTIIDTEYVVVGLHSNESIFETYELSNSRVGVIDGYDSTEELRNYLPNEEFIEGYTDTDQLVSAILVGDIDYAIMTVVEFNNYYYGLQYFDLANKHTISPAYSTIAFASDDNGKLLQSIFNKVYPFARPYEIKQEFLSYDTNVDQVLKSRSRDLFLTLMLAFLLVISLFAFFIIRIRSANNKVREIAFVDNITGLNNRTAFYNDNTHASGSLVYIDIDNFKHINEQYGHEIGDKYAYEIGQRLKEIVGTQGFELYSMAVNAYLIVGDDTNTEDKIISIAAKILYEVAKGVEIYDIDHKTTASIGIAFRKDEKGMEELFKKADTALLLAKEQGRNRYIIASEEEVSKHKKKLFLQDKLSPENIQKNVEPYFQPKVDIRDGRIIGVEALSRWDSKEQGMLYPGEFLPVLIENRNVAILDISIIAKSCVAYMEWLAKEIVSPSFIISCNVSHITIEDTDIVGVVTKLHNEIGMPYRSLELEVSERDFNAYIGTMSEKLILLARLGVNISIDDFMADQTTMAKIAQLPVNIIKVDGSLLKDGVTKQAREKIELISALAKNLNLGVIIEGVETQEQIQLLKEIPLYRVQGYYYSEAISKKSIEEEIRVKFIYRKS